jgi:hypothetical protein
VFCVSGIKQLFSVAFCVVRAVINETSKKLRPVDKRSCTDIHAFTGSARLRQRNTEPKSSEKANTVRQSGS